MDGDKQKKPKGKPSSGREKGELAEETRSGEVNNGEASPSMLAIYDEIRPLRSDLKSEMSEFRLSFHDDMKKELNEFKGEINKKLQETTKELAATTARVEEAEQRIAEIEEWDTEVKEALALMMESQETLRAKLTELEARSRRNNLRIHGGIRGPGSDRVCNEADKGSNRPAGCGNKPRNPALPPGARPKAPRRRSA